ncbi:MAG: AMP-binding protein [Candidatus Adiutrix intracellularis]|jgi:acyl-CoA synthetase (AMP-forming)/AMP-acid ligase II|nr:AMP-binding protein [Candidatus Adiutrix intracellularis]
MNPSFNIAEKLVEAAQKWPDKLAIIAENQPDVLGRIKVSFRELDEGSSRLAIHLISSGFLPGSRVLVMTKPGIDFVIIVFGLFKAGLPLVLVDPGMGLKMTLRCLAEIQPSGLAGLTRAHLLSFFIPKISQGLKMRVTVGRKWGWGGSTLAEILKQLSPDQTGKLIPVPPCPDQPAAILFTSGSTGPAKGVIYTHAMFAAQVEAISQGFDLAEGGVDLATFPPFGLFASVLGLTSVIPGFDPSRPSRADPRQLVEPIIRHQVTSLFASPTLLGKLADFGHEHRLVLPTLKLVISAGAPVSPQAVAAFTALMSPGAKLLTPYGATEGVPLSCIDAIEILNETKLMTEQGFGICVGRPLAGVKLAVIKISDEPISCFTEALKLPNGEIGEIIVQGPMVSRSYFNRPQDTACSIIPAAGAGMESEEGKFWRRMGDVGWIDDVGRLWFCGRKAHRVVTGQGILFSIPCEIIFNNHFQVRRSALVGVGPSGHQKPIIIIEPNLAFRPRDWVALTTELAALAKANPHTLSINTFLKHHALPVDVRHNAKINREQLAVWAAGELQRSR